jgi:FkbM family methyltransferase
LTGCSVFAFEANPTSFLCLAHNCKRAIKFPIALGDSASLLNLHSNNNLGSVFVSRDVSRANNASIDLSVREGLIVPCSQLDSFLIENVGFIKIDVEGFEQYVLIGAYKTIMKSRPMIWIEMSPGHLSRADSCVDNVLNQFENMRYFPAFLKGSPLQCDVMMAPIEIALSCMHTVSKVSHIVPLAVQEDFDANTAYSDLRAFFQ